ncbi:MAG: peptide ABC transporter permease [Candidatus Bathyarchaeota archaeon B23]|nr:MAG: peptide ABC transporter permease [Candidatus Bathyarchaeota archaeon B23]
MRTLDTLFYALDGVRERKFRFALNIIGILIGGAAITSLLAITQGVNRDISEQMELLGPTTIAITPGGFGIGGKGLLTMRDLERVRRIPHVAVATPIIDRAATVTIGGRTGVVSIVGIIPEEYLRVIRNIEVAEGRFIRRSDMAAAVLGSNIAQPPGEEEPIAEVGSRIITMIKTEEGVKKATFRVAGILEETGGAFIVSPDDVIYISLRSAQQLFDMGNEINRIAVEADSMEKVEYVVDAIEEELGEGVLVISAGFVRETVGRITTSLQVLLGGVAAISLIVAGIGIVNTMTISVMERTREIGILKAVGAKNRDILLIFLSEALITGVLGGALGVLSGIFLGQAISAIAQFSFTIVLSPYITPSICLIVVLFSAVTGVLSGLYPAWRASNLNPVEALRYE